MIPNSLDSRIFFNEYISYYEYVLTRDSVRHIKSEYTKGRIYFSNCHLWGSDHSKYTRVEIYHTSIFRLLQIDNGFDITERT